MHYPALARRWLERVRFATAVLLAFALLVPSSQACCDDFMSCAAAVATGGLSCAAEAALQAIQTALQALQQHRSDASSQVSSVLDEQAAECKSELAQINTKTEQLDAQIDNANREANASLLGAAHLHAKGTGAAGPESSFATTSASGAKTAKNNRGAGSVIGDQFTSRSEIDSSPSIAKLRAELAGLAAEKSIIGKELAQTEAASLAGGAAAKARAWEVLGTVLGPLDKAIQLLETLVSHPLDAGEALKDVAKSLVDADVAFVNAVVPAITQACADIADTVHRPQALLRELEKDAQRAQQLAAAIARMASLHSETERAAVVAQVNSAPAAPPPGKLTFKSKFSPQSLDRLKASFANRSEKLRHAILNVPGPVRKDTSMYHAKIAGDLDRYFKSVPAASAREKRRELIAEARTRYAKDPATLKALVKFLNDEAEARGVH